MSLANNLPCIFVFLYPCNITNNEAPFDCSGIGYGCMRVGAMRRGQKKGLDYFLSLVAPEDRTTDDSSYKKTKVHQYATGTPNTFLQHSPDAGVDWLAL